LAKTSHAVSITTVATFTKKKPDRYERDILAELDKTFFNLKCHDIFYIFDIFNISTFNIIIYSLV